MSFFYLFLLTKITETCERIHQEVSFLRSTSYHRQWYFLSFLFLLMVIDRYRYLWPITVTQWILGAWMLALTASLLFILQCLHHCIIIEISHTKELFTTISRVLFQAKHWEYSCKRPILNFQLTRFKYGSDLEPCRNINNLLSSAMHFYHLSNYSYWIKSKR